MDFTPVAFDDSRQTVQYFTARKGLEQRVVTYPDALSGMSPESSDASIRHFTDMPSRQGNERSPFSMVVNFRRGEHQAHIERSNLCISRSSRKVWRLGYSCPLLFLDSSPFSHGSPKTAPRSGRELWIHLCTLPLPA